MAAAVSNIDLDRLSVLPVEDVARRLGIEVQRHRAICFMHDDHHPSLMFSAEKNLWWCFVCDDGGGPIKLVQAYMGIPFIEACRWLEEQFGLAPNKGSEPVRHRPESLPKRNGERPSSHPCVKPDKEILTWLFDHAVLSREASCFLFEERRYSQDVVRQLGIKSISNSTNLVKNLVYHFGDERAIGSGLVVRAKDGALYGYLQAPCLIYPYRDIEGNIISVQSRYLGIHPKVPRFRFLKGTRVGLFNLPVLQSLGVDEPLYLTEGVTDCLAHLSQGHKALAIPSATLLHPEDLVSLKDRRLIIYPDADIPGRRLCEKLQRYLPEINAILEIRPLPAGCKDYSETLVR